MTARIRRTALLPLLVLCTSASFVIAEGEKTPETFFLKGQYERAEELSRPPAKTDVEASLLLVRSLLATGRFDEAVTELQAAIKRFPKSAGPLAWLGKVEFERGRYPEARGHLEAALKFDRNQLVAKFTLAELDAETGHLDEALDGYVWFVRYYNRVQPTEADDLIWVARGATQYARWKSSSQIFRFAVNTLCPDALKENSLYWPAWKVSGDLLLEKYNRAQALPEYEVALKINPRAASVYVSQAEAAMQERNYERANELAGKALKIRPNLVPAYWVLADLLLDQGKISEAVKQLEKARTINPSEQRTLGRLAGCQMLIDGVPEGEAWQSLIAAVTRGTTLPESRTDAVALLFREVLTRNPHPGPFLYECGQVIERQRRYRAASELYEAATETMPQLSAPKTALGMLAMRTGNHAEAKLILDSAFKADPFHVRISNMRKVLRVLEGYQAIETEHFVIHVDNTIDRVLGEYMADFLEETHRDLSGVLNYEPPARTHFEIYNRSKGQSGHSWFSARMVGLPWIQTVGASTGVIVALTSPTAAGEPFNWARVLRHEYVHVITLQQTKFNIPHWFTEALAVTYEGGVEPEEWSELLMQRVPTGDVRGLLELSSGFTNPKSPSDWQFAYCQSRLCAKFMIERYGEDAIAKLLDAYRRNLPTQRAITEVFGLPFEEFEQRYFEYLKEITEPILLSHRRHSQTLEEIETALKEQPDDVLLRGRKAELLFELGQRTRNQKQLREGVKIAQEINGQHPAQPEAALVMARLHVLNRDPKEAIQVLSDADDPDAPHPSGLLLRGRLLFEANRFDEAEPVLLRGLKRFPQRSDWAVLLSKLYLKTNRKSLLEPMLRTIAERKGDDASVRKALAVLALEDDRFAESIDWAREGIYIDVLDADLHRVWGLSAVELKRWPEAIRELKTALELDAELDDVRLVLARAFLSTNEQAQAIAVLEELLERSPDHAEAKRLRETLP